MNRQANNLLTLSDIAERIGVTVESCRVYHSRAVKNRRDGNVRPGDLPVPDQTFGRIPVWKERTIDRWLNARPGRGVGGGRPPGKIDQQQAKE